jgi:hypothetical protein
MTFIVALKKTPHGLLVVVTDKNAIGCVFKEKGLQLDLSKEFYKGEEMSKEETIELINKARHLHLTGGKAVDLGVEIGLVHPSRILHVGKMVHAEVMVES